MCATLGDPQFMSARVFGDFECRISDIRSFSLHKCNAWNVLRIMATFECKSWNVLEMLAVRECNLLKLLGNLSTSLSSNYGRSRSL